MQVFLPEGGGGQSGVFLCLFSLSNAGFRSFGYFAPQHPIPLRTLSVFKTTFLTKIFARIAFPLVCDDQRRRGHPPGSGDVFRVLFLLRKEQELRPALDEQQGDGVQSSGT